MIENIRHVFVALQTKLYIYIYVGWVYMCVCVCVCVCVCAGAGVRACVSTMALLRCNQLTLHLFIPGLFSHPTTFPVPSLLPRRVLRGAREEIIFKTSDKSARSASFVFGGAEAQQPVWTAFPRIPPVYTWTGDPSTLSPSPWERQVLLLSLIV